ncbi:MAG: hypothetical protein AB7O38_07700 [Pirellulaceae bacterium]
MAIGALPETQTALPPARGANRGWLFGPAWDALLIANIAWPVLVVAQLTDDFGGRAGVQFWQLYFVTTPHRWITLALVFFDRERLRSRPVAIPAVAGTVVAVCLGVHLTTGALTCLLAVDYVWNAWHFAAQHHGVYRIYQRWGEPQRLAGLAVEKWLLRSFVLYVVFRVAGTTWHLPELERILHLADWWVLTIPLYLLAGDLVRTRGVASGQTLYLISVVALYASLLGSAHYARPALLLSLATASALFHAIEYLALVSWTVRDRRQSIGVRMGWLGQLVPHWLFAVGLFVVVLGAGGWLLEQRWMKLWLTHNVVAALLHYAYDGMIWRKSRTKVL